MKDRSYKKTTLFKSQDDVVTGPTVNINIAIMSTPAHAYDDDNESMQLWKMFQQQITIKKNQEYQKL